MPDYSAYPNGLVPFRNLIAFEGEQWQTISLALPWWPDEPTYEWMIPGTYTETEVSCSQP